MFSLTQAAAQQIQQSARSSGAQHLALRVAARIEADGSIQYGMGFDDPHEQDMKLELQGVAVVISTEFQELLEDTVLDFVEMTPGEFNFIFFDAQSFSAGASKDTSGGCASGACSGGGCGSKGIAH